MLGNTFLCIFHISHPLKAKAIMHSSIFDLRFLSQMGGGRVGEGKGELLVLYFCFQV